MPEKQKRKTFTSTAVKTRWNRKHYDKIAVLLPKGTRERLAVYAAKRGMSVNGYMNYIVRDMLGVPEEDWKPMLEDKKEEAE